VGTGHPEALQQGGQVLALMHLQGLFRLVPLYIQSQEVGGGTELTALNSSAPPRTPPLVAAFVVPAMRRSST